MKSIKWDITGNCNLKCIHCITGDKYLEKKTKELSLKDKLKIIDKLAEGGVSSVNLLGGEPLTLGDDFYSIIEYGVSKGIHMSSNTNGLLLNSDVIKRLANTGISGLTVSIEGPSSEAHDAIRGRGTFEKIVNNVRNLTQYISKEAIPINVFINTVLNKQNFYNVEKMVDLCLDLKVNKWSLLQLGYEGYAKDHINNLAITTEEVIDTAIRVARRIDPDFNDLKNLTFENRFTYLPLSILINQEYDCKLPYPETCCTGSLSFGFVDPYGNMYACERLPNDYEKCSINSAPIKKMNLLDYDFYEIWNSGYFMEMFPLISNKSTYKNYEPCNHCKFLFDGKCTPCPLNSLSGGKVIIDDCLYVEQKSGNVNNVEAVKQVENLQYFDESKIKEDIKKYTKVKAFNFEQQYPMRINGIRSFKKKEKYILFNPYTLVTLELNKMGTRLWDIMDGDISVHEICNLFSDEISSLPVSEELFKEKTQYFLYLLNKNNLITFSDTSSQQAAYET